MNILGAISNAVGFANQLSVTIGTLTLGDFEIPESIRTRGDQVLAVHRLVGGGKVINAMGRDDAPIRLSGIWSGPSAMQRCRAMDAMRDAGRPVPLTWGVRLYTAVIRSHEAEDRHNQYWIPFTVECEVYPPPPPPAQPANAQAGIVSDLQSAVASASGAVASALAPIAGAITTAQTALNIAGPLLPGRALGSAAVLLANAGGAVDTGLSTADAAFLATAPGNLSGLLTGSGDLAFMAQARGYVQRAAANVAQVV